MKVAKVFFMNLFLISLLVTTGTAVAQVTALPTAPRPQETVRIVVPQVFNDAASQNQSQYNIVDTANSSVTMVGNKVTIALTVARSDFPAGPTGSLDMPVGQFPAGNYQVDVIRRTPEGGDFGSVGSTAFTVTPRAAGSPIWNHTDIWYDPSESGWGLNVVQHGSGKIFATWFVYGADGKATWFVVPDGAWQTTTQYRGLIYRTTGPSFQDCTIEACPVPFNPALVNVSLVGEMVLSFHPSLANVGAVVMTIDGQSISKNLQRQSF